MVHILNLLISLAPLFLSAIATVDVEILQKRTAAPKACLPAVHGKLFQVRAVSDGKHCAQSALIPYTNQLT